jgi:hypothetical protein
MAQAIVENPAESSQRRVAAARLLVAADAVNARREATASRERETEQGQTVSVIRAALSTPEGRAALARLSDTLCQDEGGQARALPAPEEKDG